MQNTHIQKVVEDIGWNKVFFISPLPNRFRHKSIQVGTKSFQVLGTCGCSPQSSRKDLAYDGENLRVKGGKVIDSGEGYNLPNKKMRECNIFHKFKEEECEYS